MKLWKKVYIFTLVITVFCINIGILGLFRITYKQMLSAEKQHCESEFTLLQQSVSAKITEMEQNVPLTKKYFSKFLNSYSSWYGQEISLIGLYQEEVIFQNNGEDSKEPEPIDLQRNGVQIKEGKITTIFIIDSIDEAHPSYRIILKKELKEFDETWSILWPLFTGGSLLLSIAISLVLGIVVKHLMKPIDQLIDMVNKIRFGDLSERVMLKGHNELTDLGMHFNDMAEALENNMQLLEEEIQKKQQLIDNLAHEMNTPITSIQGFAQFLQIGDVKEEERQECLGFILGEAKRLKEISSTLLEIARLNHNEVLMETFSIKKLCQRLEILMDQECQKQDITFTLDCQAEDFFGNEVLIESLMRNLFHNSLRALAGKGMIAIEVSNKKKEKIPVLSISVKDDGCGVPEDALSDIFEPFYRVDKSRNRESGGSGLGLPFCRMIAQLHGGDIVVRSKEGVGTEMTVALPI